MSTKEEMTAEYATDLAKCFITDFTEKQQNLILMFLDVQASFEDFNMYCMLSELRSQKKFCDDSLIEFAQGRLASDGLQ